MTRDDSFRSPYLFAIAGLFAFLCGLSSLRYLWLDVAGGPSVAAWTQFLCFALTAGSVTFFFRPRVGYFAMLTIALVVLLVEAPGGAPAAVVFWLGILALLLMHRVVPPIPNRSAT